MASQSKRAKRDRGPGGKFLPGHTIKSPGNPNLRHAAELQAAVRTALEPKHLVGILRRMANLALDGDPVAARLVLERCLGKPREEPGTLNIELPALDTAAGIADAMRSVVAAAAAGDATPSDAAAAIALLRQVADATVFEELADRVAQLERSTK